nr:mechanosensitive ion channel family protein [Vibrio vulnificus]
MNQWTNFEQWSQYIPSDSFLFKLLMALVLFATYQVVKKISNRAVANLALSKGVNKARQSFIQRAFNTALLFLFASIFSVIA